MGLRVGETAEGGVCEPGEEWERRWWLAEGVLVERCKDGTLTPTGEKPLGDFDQKTNIVPLHV